VVSLARWELKFMDGSSEIADLPGGTWFAWLIGRARARAKKTYLLNIERAD